jgi:diadenosine tetraphosphate (Ap4A) HIT family hydrolase
MSTHIHRQVAAARAGTEPALICQMPSGWAVLCNMQYLSGYCILLPDPVAPSLNALTREKRAEYLCDMSTIGDALLDVTDAFRINYAIMGNSDPALHAHIVPRYMSEPEHIRKHLPWSYPQAVMDDRLFDAERDQELIEKLAEAIKKRL